MLTALSRLAVAQDVNDIGQWNAVFMQDKIAADSKVRWWFDGHYRLFEDNDGFGQSIVRPGLGLDISKNSALWAGYGWIRTSPIQGNDTDEHRIWQQWTWSETAKPFKFALRTRFEQRQLESSDDTGLRLRQFVRCQKTLDRCATRTFVVWDEMFIALNDTDFGQRDGFDQNRLFVGFGFKRFRNSTWRAEIGYMLQSINQQGPSNRHNHILALNIFRSPTR